MGIVYANKERGKKKLRKKGAKVDGVSWFSVESLYLKATLELINRPTAVFIEIARKKK